MKNIVPAALLCAASLQAPPVHAQTSQAPSSPSTPLYQTVAGLDARLFNAYNTCDLKTLGEMVADDLEFYHDKTGLAVGKKPFLEAIQNNICGKVTRELVPSSMEVYPLNTYGAVEIGTHRFLHPSDPTNPPGIGRFITVWQQKDGTWKVTRVISYDHKAAQ